MIKIDDVDLINGSKQIIRHLKLSTIQNDSTFTFEPIKMKDYRYRVPWGIRKRRRVIKLVADSHGLLTGSKVLSKSYINGRRILDRSVIESDWDFLITKDNALNVTRCVNFEQYAKGRLEYRLIESSGYSSDDQYLDLILVNDLPTSYDVGGFRYTCPLHILETKLNLIELVGDSMFNRIENYIQDIKEFYWKFGYLINQ